MNLIKYQGEKLNVEVYPNFISPEFEKELFTLLDNNVKWSSKITSGRRVNQNYGDTGVSYKFSINSKIIERIVHPWEQMPILQQIRDYLSSLTQTNYNYCVVQRYPNGNVGINPHRDKEMVSGTDIAGISLGTSRILTLTPPRSNRIDTIPIHIDLPPGSLYILKPPTNDHWLHSIEKDNSTTPRISLTYRLN